MVAVAGASLLGVSLSTPPGSPRFYGLTLGVAGTWVVGGLASGPLHLGRMFGPGDTLRRPVLTPLASGVGAFGAFYAAALVARAEQVSRSLDWSEVTAALAAHPRIGDRVAGSSAEAAASSLPCQRAGPRTRHLAKPGRMH